MAVFAFVFSLIGILASAAAWWIEIFPIALAVTTLFVVSSDKRRGRALAVWAIVIGLCVGSCSYVAHSGARELASRVAGSVLSALSSDASDAEKDDVLAPWMHRPSLKTDARAKIRARFDRVTAEYGKYVHPPDVGGFFSSMTGILLPPDNIEEIGRTEDVDTLPAPRPSFWVTAKFEKGPIVVAVEIMAGKIKDMGSLQGDLQPGAAAPLVSDVRFFKKKGQ